MENSPSPGVSSPQAGAEGTTSSASGFPPLHKPHDDLDILEGCPRELTIQGVRVETRAFKNNEFTKIGSILLYFGFATCETPEDVDAISLNEIYNNCILNSAATIGMAGYDSFEAFLFELMQWPEGSPSAKFRDIQSDEFKRFFALVIEQNNLITAAKKNAKRMVKEANAKTSTI
jgi:hypothetical protein